MKRKNLVLVDTGLFFEGMRIEAGIYYLYEGSYVLLCKNVIFTPELIKRLRNAAKATSGVFIEEKNYDEVWNESLRQYSRDATVYNEKFKKIKHHYNKVLLNTVDLLKEVSYETGVSLETADKVTSSIVDELSKTDESMMLQCINMIHTADDYLYTHSVNVATLSGMVAKWMGMTEMEIKRMIKIGLLHDLGKLKVPPEILYKPSILTNVEFEAIKYHPVYSYEMLQKSGEQDSVILQSVRHHHEKPNGRGYPDGLTLQDISLEARITSVCDVYDAMVSKRCYKEPITPFEVLSQFKENKFSDLDPQVVDIFLENIVFLFIGMKVNLSNGDKGEVVFVKPTDYAYPLVKVDNRIFSTNEFCRCVGTGSGFFDRH